MFEYLVSSRTRRELLGALWRDGARGTASSLARRTRVPVGASYGELHAMSRAGLARRSAGVGPARVRSQSEEPVCSGDQTARLAEFGRALRRKARSRRVLGRRSSRARRRGCPALEADAREVAAETPLAELLARACELAHHDPSVAKLLPYLLLRKKDALHLRSLRASADRAQAETHCRVSARGRGRAFGRQDSARPCRAAARQATNQARRLLHGNVFEAIARARRAQYAALRALGTFG